MSDKEKRVSLTEDQLDQVDGGARLISLHKTSMKNAAGIASAAPKTAAVIPPVKPALHVTGPKTAQIKNPGVRELENSVTPENLIGNLLDDDR